MPDWEAEEAEQDIDKYIEEWIKRYRIRNVLVVDMLLRQVVRYHAEEICRNIEKQ